VLARPLRGARSGRDDPHDQGDAARDPAARPRLRSPALDARRSRARAQAPRAAASGGELQLPRQIDASLPAEFRWAAEPVGSCLAPAGRRTHLLDVNASVSDGRLEVEWTYASRATAARRSRSSPRATSSRCARSSSHCQDPRAGSYTPSDFPDAGLDQKELDRILAAVRGAEEGRAAMSARPRRASLLGFGARGAPLGAAQRTGRRPAARRDPALARAARSRALPARVALRRGAARAGRRSAALQYTTRSSR
jgi:non-ribosomal peptide synthase protein (TIGR01720 family)